MKVLFWSSLSLIFCAYVGYPIYLYFRAKLCPRPIQRGYILPRVTIVLAVHNEEKSLPAKLCNLAALDYPPNLLDVIVVSDGSSDQTNRILLEWQNPNCRVLILPEHCGKASALNYGMAEANGEIICFADARQTIASDGLNNLVANFADPSVGCVSGALILRGCRNAVSSEGVSLYWDLEKKMRNWEGLAGSTVGATGAFYAIRRDLLSPIPVGTILDDAYIPLQVVRQGKRVIFDPRSVAWDDFTPSLGQEFRRKVRTLTGNYQLLALAPWVITTSNPLRSQFICHKLLRLLVPIALIGILISASSVRHGIYELAFVFQIIFYALAASATWRTKPGFLSRLANISLAFIVLNTAAAVALVNFITSRKPTWAS